MVLVQFVATVLFDGNKETLTLHFDD